VVYGYGRFGQHLVRRLRDRGLHVLVVDWDPRSIGAGEDESDLDVVFGDAEDAEYPANLPLRDVPLVVSTVPSAETSRALTEHLRRWGYRGALALTAHDDDTAGRLDDLGVDLVLRPFRDAAATATDELLELASATLKSPPSAPKGG
jgi:Trk K+ transport system NAD-binding subunit